MSELAPLAGEATAHWLQKLSPVCRLLTVLFFSLSVVSLTTSLLQLAALGCSVLLVFFSGLSIKALLKRLLPIELFLLLVVVFLPFTMEGEHAGNLFGLFAMSDAGLERAIEILLRANTVVLASLVLLATLEPEEIGYALNKLSVPQKLVQLFLMTVRYVSVLSQEYHRLRTAMRARAFQPGSNLHTWRSLGWLMGMLLVRSIERSERVTEAMKCRGFDGHFRLMGHADWQLRDTIFLMLTLSLSAILLTLEYL